MRLTILISCMHQQDTSIIKRSNVQSDVIVVNQCASVGFEEFEFENTEGSICKAKMQSTTERGLSKSRNMAMSLAEGDICLLADDDLVYYDNYKSIVEEAYERFQEADIILFDFEEEGCLRARKKPRESSGRLNYISLLRGNSVRISFRRDRLVNLGVSFQECFGAGSNIFTSAEDLLFLADAYRKGAKIYYYDRKILRLLPDDGGKGSSTWFRGFDEQYYRNIGGFAAHYLPRLSLLYIVQFVLRHRAQGALSFWKKMSLAREGVRLYREQVKK